MAIKNPIALYNGELKELQSGDTVAGASAVSGGLVCHGPFAFDEASSSPLTLFTPDEGDTILTIRVHVESAATSSGASLAIGTALTYDEYLTEADVELTTIGIYEIPLDALIGVSPSALLATIVAGEQTFSGTIYVIKKVGD